MRDTASAPLWTRRRNDGNRDLAIQLSALMRACHERASGHSETCRQESLKTRRRGSDLLTHFVNRTQNGIRSRSIQRIPVARSGVALESNL
jgi:hypothetical protein